MRLVQDIWHNEIFPQLDNISFLCLQVAFCHTKLKVDRCEKLLDEVVTYSPDFVQYFISQQLLTDVSKLLLAAARFGNLRLIQDLQSSSPIINWPLIAHESTRYGQLAIIKYIFSTKELISDTSCLGEAAVEYDQLECLLFYFSVYSYDIDDLAHIAAIHGSLECLKYIIPRLHEQPNKLWLVSEVIDHSDSIDCVKYLIEAFQLPLAKITKLLPMVYASISLRMLEYLVSVGVVLTREHTRDLLLYNDNINRLTLFEFLHKFDLVARITNFVIYQEAIKFPDVVQFLLSINAYLPEKACRLAVKHGSSKSLFILHAAGYSLNNCMRPALKYCPSVITYLVQNGQSIPDDAWLIGVDKNFDTLIFLHKHHPESIPQNIIQLFVETIENNTMVRDDYIIFRALCAMGYKPSHNTLYSLLQLDNIACTIYAIISRFPWNAEQCFDYLDTLDVDDPHYLLINKLLQNMLKYETINTVYDCTRISQELGDFIVQTL